ncbi:hypothetical protein COOONC_08815 [Cooperia oncophora]
MNSDSHFRDILSSKPKSLLSACGFDDSKQESDLFEILACANPEIINVRVKDESDCVEDSFADNEEHSFNFDLASTSQTHLDLLAQAHCLVSSPPRDTSPPTAKRSRNSNGDPNKDYHTCQMCGTRVKAPRGGRWNLQMHVMAMHSSFRPYKCRSCDFQDYRKPGMRKHCILTHGEDMDPVDIRDILSSKPKSLLSACGFDDSKQESDLFEILACANPEIINVRVKDESDCVEDSFADNEEHSFNFDLASTSQSKTMCYHEILNRG